MKPQHRHRPVRQGGFSLIELMIALVAGMIVVGAVLAFTVSSVRSNSQYVRSTRLMQELRNANDHIVSELKRAGYDEAAMAYVANQNSTAVSRFAPMLVDNSTVGSSCVVYAYDRKPGRPGAVDADNGEIRAMRRKTVDGVGVIEVAESSSTVTPACNGAQPDYSQYPTTCNSNSGWCPLSDPRSLDVTGFTVSTVASGTDSTGVTTLPGGSGYNAMQLREFQITLAGHLLGNDAADARSIRSNIRVRADCLRGNLSACSVAPVATP